MKNQSFIEEARQKIYHYYTSGYCQVNTSCKLFTLDEKYSIPNAQLNWK